MRFIKLLGLAFFATLALGAFGAGGASAFHPLFLTQSGKPLLFNAISLLGVLRGLNAGLLGIIHCELDLAHGFVLHNSPLIHFLKIIFHTKCEQEINGTLTKCTEPIETGPVLGELGLLVLPSGEKDIVILLAPTGTTEFVKVTCGSNVTTVEGAVVGEIPASARGEEQINHDVLELLANFSPASPGSENQRYNSIELLGTNMTGAELKVSGFFGGKASEEDEVHIKFDGLVLICTH